MNVRTDVKNNVLTITVDLAHEGGLSKSGKSTLVASTNGTVKLGEFSMGLNIWKAPK